MNKAKDGFQWLVFDAGAESTYDLVLCARNQFYPFKRIKRVVVDIPKIAGRKYWEMTCDEASHGSILSRGGKAYFYNIKYQRVMTGFFFRKSLNIAQ